METIHKIGRRKKSVARVYLTDGSGDIQINNKKLDEYFTTATLKFKVNQVMNMTGNEDKFDIRVKVFGGGINGQAEAIRLALARALVELDAENHAVLKPEGLLTRDPRMVERKKYGQKKARKQFQFSKR